MRIKPWWFQPQTLASLLFFIVTLLAALWYLAIPNLQRLHISLGATLFDYGFYGLYPTQQYKTLQNEATDVELAMWDSRCSSEYTFLAPRGTAHTRDTPMILDSLGELVWIMDPPASDTVQDFRVQEYQGEKYLTFWHGAEVSTHGEGYWSMLDSSYEHLFDVRAAGNFHGDLHEFHITENGTALIIIYQAKPADLTSLGGPEMGFIFDGIIQEIEIAAGSLLFEWHISDHVPFNNSMLELRGQGRDSSDAFDPYHLNSVDKDQAGNYLLSSRHLNSIMSIDRNTGELLWILGGRLNEFTDASDGHATNFAWQHDARWRDERTITLMDNSAYDFMDEFIHSRGMTLDLDVPNRVASLRAVYSHPDGMRALSQGNMQVLESGNVLIGWGHCAAFTEFAASGEALCDTHFGPSNWFQLGKLASYRVTKAAWTGRPHTPPSAVIVGDSVFVSWNGATEVASWRLEAWDDSSDGTDVDDDEMQFAPVDVVAKEGFETEIKLPPGFSDLYCRVVALDDQGSVIGVTSLLGKSSDHPSAGYFFGLFFGELSLGGKVAIIMAGCSPLVLLSWAWNVVAGCRARRRYEEYQLVALTSAED